MANRPMPQNNLPETRGEKKSPNAPSRDSDKNRQTQEVDDDTLDDDEEEEDDDLDDEDEETEPLG